MVGRRELGQPLLEVRRRRLARAGVRDGAQGDLDRPAEVVVNLYYTPFSPTLDCLGRFGLSKKRQRLLLNRLSVLNAVLAKGARAYGFKVVQPDFSGHTMCSSDPYVQGLVSPAPFHPTAAGQLAIALADEGALTGARRPT